MPGFQMGGFAVILGLATVVVLLAAVYTGVAVISATEYAVLTVLGEKRGVLEPGINFVPPFVSQVRRFSAEQQLEINAEALSADETPTEMTASVSLIVANPTQWIDPDHEAGSFRDQCRELLRTQIDRATDQELADDPRTIELRLRDGLVGQASDWGVDIQSVAIQSIEQSTGGSG